MTQRGKGLSRSFSASLPILVLLLAAAVVNPWWHHRALDGLYSERDHLLDLRQDALAIERELLLARGDEVEILSARHPSLSAPLRARHLRVERQIQGLAARLSVLDHDVEPLQRAIEEYFQSVAKALELVQRIGGHEGSLTELHSLERRLLDRAPASARSQLLEMQVLAREFATGRQTSKDLGILDRVDALRASLPASDASLDEVLMRYRQAAEAAMSDALAIERVRSESSLRSSRLPPMFRAIEDDVETQLADDMAQITRLRRNAGLWTTVLLSAALLVIALRSRRELRDRRRLKERITRLADGMQAFTVDHDEAELDLPRSGQLASATRSFLDMAGRVRHQISAIEAERRRAKDALQVKADFLARVSHELRTPLHGILGMSELLGQSVRPGREAHLVDNVRRSGATLLSVVNDVLDFSKLEAGKLDLHLRPYDLEALLEHQIEAHAPLAHAKGLDLVLTLSTAPCRLLIDPARLGQVLTNLIGNAVKFTDTGTIEVVLERCEPNAAGDRCTVQWLVRDTGPGIPAALHADIFEPFAQAEALSRRSHGGSGLGLSIVREIVELMDGSVVLRSPPPGWPAQAGAGRRAGRGTHVEVTFSAAVADAEPSSDRLDDRLLLLVDTHLLGATALADRLRRRGAYVQTTAELAEVVAIVDRRSPDAVLLVYPTVGGDEDFSRLRTALDRRRVPTLSLLPTPLWDEGGESETTSVQKAASLSKLVTAFDGLRGSTRHAHPAEPIEALATDEPIAGRILLAEDNPINRELIVLMLEESGCDVVMAGNGREAVESLQAEPFDVVLMDCHMPEMDGIAAAEAIRRLADRRRATIPIIGLTASAFELNLKRCREAGMNEVLSKPASRDQLVASLRRWLPAAQPEGRTDSLQ